MSFTHTMRPFAVPKNTLRSMFCSIARCIAMFCCCYNQCLQIPTLVGQYGGKFSSVATRDILAISHMIQMTTVWLIQTLCYLRCGPLLYHVLHMCNKSCLNDQCKMYGKKCQAGRTQKPAVQATKSIFPSRKWNSV